MPLVGATIGGILVGIVVAFFDFPDRTDHLGRSVPIGYQQIENYLIQPFVYGSTVQVHPLVVIVAILIGATLLGMLGALIAIPSPPRCRASSATGGASDIASWPPRSLRRSSTGAEGSALAA